jgi:hypothetical protein
MSRGLRYKRSMRPFLFLLVATSAFAQGPLMESILPQFETMRKNIEETAELFPEADYGYRLTPPQRSVAEWMDHNIAMNYAFCSRFSTAPAPDAASYKGLKEKAVYVKTLKESFAYCDQALHSQTDETILKPFGPRNAIPVGGLMTLFGMWNEHYGNLVGYIRSKGMVPPSSSRAAAPKK